MTNDMNDIINNMTDPFYKNIILYRFYLNKEDNDKALVHLLISHSLDPESNILNLEFELGMIYRDYDINKAIEYLKKGIDKKDTRCNLSLAEILYDNNNIFEACKYLIDCCKNNEIFAINKINDIIHKHASFEIGKLLLDNDLDLGINCLIQCNTPTDKIVECANKFIYYSECNICFNENKQFKSSCGHYLCIDCLRKCQYQKCPFCKNKFNGYLQNTVYL